MGKFLALALVLVAVAAIGGLLYRPGAVIGVSGKSLAHSVRGEVGAEETGVCSEAEADRFVCTVVDADRRTEASYRIEIKDAGCWEGSRRAKPAGGSRPQEISGCLTIVDLVRAD